MYVESVYSELTRSYHDLRYLCNSVTHEGLLLIHSWCFHAESQQLLDVATDDDWRVDHGWMRSTRRASSSHESSNSLSRSWDEKFQRKKKVAGDLQNFPKKTVVSCTWEHRNLGVDMEIPSLNILKPQISAALGCKNTKKNNHFHTKSYQNFWSSVFHLPISPVLMDNALSLEDQTSIFQDAIHEALLEKKHFFFHPKKWLKKNDFFQHISLIQLGFFLSSLLGLWSNSWAVTFDKRLLETEFGHKNHKHEPLGVCSHIQKHIDIERTIQDHLCGLWVLVSVHLCKFYKVAFERYSSLW